MVTSNSSRDESLKSKAKSKPIVMSFKKDQGFIIITYEHDPGPTTQGNVKAEITTPCDDGQVRICANQLTEDDIYQTLLQAVGEMAVKWGMKCEYLLVDVEDRYDAAVCWMGGE